MRTYHSPGTTMTPEVTFSEKDATLSIAGECYPENPLLFFSPLFNTLSTFFSEYHPADFRATIHLHYINSASTKAFRQLFRTLDAAAESGTTVHLQWIFDPEDDALQDLGNDLAEDMQFLDYLECPTESVA